MRNFAVSILLFVLAYLLISRQFIDFANDPGLGWHLRNGEFISLNSEIPYIDPFLSSAVPRTWISDQWFADVLLFRGLELFSWPLLYSLSALIFIFCFLLPPGYILNKTGCSFLSFAFAALISIRLAAVHFVLRPVLLSFLFFSLLLYMLHRFKHKGIRISDYFFSGLLFLFWANIHPSFVLGIFALMVYGLTERLSKNSASLLVFCLLITFINPYGFDLHRSILQLSASQYFLNLNSEWKPLLYTSAEGLLAIACGIFTIVSFLFRRNVFSLYSYLLLIIFNILIFHSIRFLPYYALVLLPLLATAVDDVLQKLFNFKPQGNPKPNLIAFALGSFLVLLSTFIFKSPPAYSESFGPSKALYPYACMKYLNEMPFEGGVAAHPNWGGFIIWQSKAQQGVNLIKPQIDDRNTLLGEDSYKEFFGSMTTPDEVKGYMRSKLLRLLLLSSDSRLLQTLRNDSNFKALQCDEFTHIIEFNED